MTPHATDPRPEQKRLAQVLARLRQRQLATALAGRVRTSARYAQRVRLVQRLCSEAPPVAARAR